MILRRLRAMLGAENAVEIDALGMPCVAPQTEQECALVLRTAAKERWRVRIDGAGSWMPADAPADLAVTTRRMTRVPFVDPTDLVATAEAGVLLQDLRTTLADKGMWVAIDAPGTGRSVGSAIATGTAGPLRTGYGPIRDHILGLTLVTGDGRVVHAGGKVMKNVAGFDIARLATGSFGCLGIVTSVNLRLRTVPRADVTLVAEGPRDRLLRAARSVLATGTTPGAMLIASPRATGADAWSLAARLIGSDVSVELQQQTVTAAMGSLTVRPLGVRDSGAYWRGILDSSLESPITLRLGAVPTALEDALDMVSHHLDDERITVNVRAGAVRWSGEAQPNRLRLLRFAGAQREMPVTLERADWATREAVGHFGAYREGTGRIIESLRLRFDPAGILVVPLDAGNAQ